MEMKTKKVFTSMLLLCAVTTVLVLGGCGGEVKVSPPASSSTTVSGVASLDATAGGAVSVKDSSAVALEKTTSISSNGSYSVNVKGLTPPFIIKAEGTSQAGDRQVLYSLSRNGGRTNINSLSDIAVAASADADATNASTLYAMQSSDEEAHRRTTDNFYAVISQLRTVLAPLFALYEVSGNGVNNDDNEYEQDNSGLRAMLNDVRFIIRSRTVTVTNRQTGGVIYSGRLNDLSSGTFYPENMPGGSGGSATCTSFTYSAWGACQSDNTQTRTVAASSPAGCAGGTPVLSQACNYVPPVTACTYNYSNWGTCQSNNTQARAVTSSSPVGCVGIPVLSQACTYVPPVTACSSFTYSAWGACRSNNTQTRTQLTASPAGCTGGTPVLTQSCTYVPPVTSCSSFTYSAWGACQSNNTQTRTQLTASPAGCTGGTPVLTQSCTYVPPVTACTSFTYSAWGACQSNNTQTRTQLTASPAGCTGGTPVLSQSCTYVPPAQTCGSCHAIPPSTGQHSFHYPSRVSSCSTCHGTGYSPTAVTAATHMNGVTNVVSSMNYNATTGTCGSPGCHGARAW